MIDEFPLAHVPPSAAHDVWLWVRLVCFYISFSASESCSDVTNPLPESIDVMEELVLDYIQDMVRLASPHKPVQLMNT